jgi:hypothetical protein
MPVFLKVCQGVAAKKYDKIPRPLFYRKGIKPGFFEAGNGGALVRDGGDGYGPVFRAVHQLAGD